MPATELTVTPLSATLDTVLDTLTISQSFPWLCTRVVPALYHITLLPADAPLSRLLAIAGQQLAANRLSTCLALGPGRATYLEPDGRVSRSDIVPSAERC